MKYCGSGRFRSPWPVPPSVLRSYWGPICWGSQSARILFAISVWATGGDRGMGLDRWRFFWFVPLLGGFWCAADGAYRGGGHTSRGGSNAGDHCVGRARGATSVNQPLLYLAGYARWREYFLYLCGQYYRLGARVALNRLCAL